MRAATKVFAEKGFANATVRDIAYEAEILSGSLYYYFNSKEEMVEEVLSSYLEITVAGYRRAVKESNDPVEAFEELIRVALRGVVQYRDEVTILQNDWHYVGPLKMVAIRQREVEQIWLDVIEQGVAAGVFRSDLGTRMIYRTVLGSIQTVIRWFDPHGENTVDNVIDVQCSLFLDGMRATD
ncbi:TetR/AcrR family transcriptional regulator [Nocardiopsis quinghaiensis]|uniref:TetR/AcrR family transcriptional regulator n=1 Tax=Nocardiopsis quinghaiensis TaxID=464995 RepID=UPI0016816DEA|nr:TetR/AcrR family transcriptional regulator [Nocardiopsis quinghaiensis]